jgi:hypothetical protein
MRADKKIPSAPDSTPILITPRKFKSVEEFIAWQRARDLFELANQEKEKAKNNERE